MINKSGQTCPFCNIFADMKKTTIWLIAIVMGLSFLVLLFMQLKYIQAMVQMKKEQFDESVNKALYQASRNLELNETLKYLERDVNASERKSHGNGMPDEGSGGAEGAVQYSHQYDKTDNGGVAYSSFELKTMRMKPSSMPKAMILRSDKNSISEATRSMQEIVKNRYIYQKALLDEVVYSILYTASDKPLRERINFKMLDQDIKTELMNNGVDIPYHFTVSTRTEGKFTGVRTMSTRARNTRIPKRFSATIRPTRWASCAYISPT